MDHSLASGELKDSYTTPYAPLQSRMETRIRQVPTLSVESAALVLTIASLTITPSEGAEVLVFCKNISRRLRLTTREEDDGPALVAFLVPRATAEGMVLVDDHIGNISIPPSHRLISAAAIINDPDEEEDCLRFLRLLSSYRPASYLQQGFLIGASGFTFVSLGLDERKICPEIPWDHPTILTELGNCVKLIRDEATRLHHPAVPKLVDVITVETHDIGLYSSQIGGQPFSLLPLLSRSEGRKPFVALGVSEDGQHVRVVKYSWYKDGEEWRELKLLRKLRDVPGVVHLDDELTQASLESNVRNRIIGETGWRTRGLLVLKTIGYPLCTCESVLEFLEAMYDLLEVLRYLVQEKNILHRDVSWSNVLIRAREIGGGSYRRVKRSGKYSGDTIPHTYRFISDIFDEDERNIRVALTDFDHASEVRTGQEAELKDRAGTQMFMAEDALSVRTSLDMAMTIFSVVSEMVGDKVLDAADDKYADPDERREWDNFYRNFTDLQWKIMPKTRNNRLLEESFRHGAVHDAESVFYLCLLFFNRMWPFNERIDRSEQTTLEADRGDLFEVLEGRTCSAYAFRLNHLQRASFGTGARLDSIYDMLSAMFVYLRVPWYNVETTGRCEPHEFHLHDFMQRLLLKEITGLRAAGDPIFIEQNPLPVGPPRHSVSHTCDEYPNFTFVGLRDGGTGAERKRCKGLSHRHNDRGRSINHGHNAATSKRVRRGKENSAKKCFCERGKKRLANTSKSDTLVLPVDRPREMPERCKRKFSRHTELWEIYWSKIREKRWVTAML